MKRVCFLSWLVLVVTLFLLPQPAAAGAKLRISDDATLDVGFLMQALYLNLEANTDQDPQFELANRFLVRRAFVTLSAEVGQSVGVVLTTDLFDDALPSGFGMRLTAAYGSLLLTRGLALEIGLKQAPVTRQNLVSSAALLSIDRPSLAYKNLAWGARARAGFNQENFYAPGLITAGAVADLGATVSGAHSASPLVHLKYAAGAYGGARSAAGTLRYTGRAQVNFLDPEPGYAATYLGQKKTIAFGLAADYQPDVEQVADAITGRPNGQRADYLLYTADGFFEHPIGSGALTLEGGWMKLDLGGALYSRGTATEASAWDTRQASGTGYYAQGGFYLYRFQPWVQWEQWSADAGDPGSYRSIRFGISYFIKGQNANVKAGYEIYTPASPFPGTAETSKSALALGIFTAY